MMRDEQMQRRQSAPVALDGPRPLPAPLPAQVIEALAAIRRRDQLLRSEVYARHAAQLLELTYGLQYAPPPRDAAPRVPFVRVGAWNIQRGIHLDKIKRLLGEHELLRAVDVWLLSEVDVGMARSANRHVAAELAEALGFGFVFGNSYLCLDHGDARDGTPHGENGASLHGNAILSRYPVLRAENFSVAITKDKFHSSEKRLGHKKALWAEVQTPLGPLPVIAVHLDSFASAAQRGAQLKDVVALFRARDLSGRVLLGGDLNTTTYDAKHAGQIVINVLKKLIRGGFPHAIHHYLHPEELYERPVFAALSDGGLTWQAFNAPHVGTSRYEVGSFASESKVSEQLPAFAVKILRRKLRPWGGVAALKLDWFAGRGLQVARPGVRGPAGRAVPPTVFARPTIDGTLLSDHDPVVVDVCF